MYICTVCGETKEDLKVMRDGHGFSDGYYEEWCDTDCYCGGEFVEAKKCPICGQYFAPTDDETICEDCFVDYSCDADSVIEFTQDDVDTFKIKGLASYFLTEDEMSEILENFIRDNIFDYKEKMKILCEEYKRDFCEFLKKKEGRKN